MKIRPNFIPDEQRRTYKDKIAETPKPEPVKISNPVILPNRIINVKKFLRVKKVIQEEVKKIEEIKIEAPKEKTFEEKVAESKAKLKARQKK